MQLELSARRIPLWRKNLSAWTTIGIENKGQCVTQRYFADLVCFEQFMVEMKALKQLSGKEDAQIVNYVGGG